MWKSAFCPFVSSTKVLPFLYAALGGREGAALQGEDLLKSLILKRNRCFNDNILTTVGIQPMTSFTFSSNCFRANGFCRKPKSSGFSRLRSKASSA